MAFSAPHTDLGETVGLLVVAAQPQDIGLVELQRSLLQKLSPPKVPEVLIFAPDIPKGRTGKPERIGFAMRFNMQPVCAGTPVSKRVFVADSVTGLCELKHAPWLEQGARGIHDDETASDMMSGTDSLGFSRQVRSGQDLQAAKMQDALYGICIAKLLWQHWLPHGSIGGALPLQSDWLISVLQSTQDCRTLIVMIFALLGFFDGRAALLGQSPLRKAGAVLFVYVAMAWPKVFPAAEAEFATFHRWPLWVWLWCLAVVTLCKRVPPMVLVVSAFSLAPVFRDTLDNLHERLGGLEKPGGGAWEDPSLLILEHRFYFSLGDHIYFVGCYLLAFNYLAQPHMTDRILAWARSSPPLRLGALGAFLVLTTCWEHGTIPYDPSKPAELRDWPRFFGPFYPFMAMIDWLAMGLLVVACGEGFALIRLMGSFILGTMACHMWLQLPFETILRDSAMIGGPALVLASYCLTPILYCVSVGRIFQAILTLPMSSYNMLPGKRM